MAHRLIRIFLAAGLGAVEFQDAKDVRVRNPEDRCISICRNMDERPQHGWVTKIEFGAVQDWMTFPVGSLLFVCTYRRLCLYERLGGKRMDIGKGRCTINGDVIFDTVERTVLGSHRLFLSECGGQNPPGE